MGSFMIFIMISLIIKNVVMEKNVKWRQIRGFLELEKNERSIFIQ
jgi:hypothetical protein